MAGKKFLTAKHLARGVATEEKRNLTTEDTESTEWGNRIRSVGRKELKELKK